jgi:hypothetical protein
VTRDVPAGTVAGTRKKRVSAGEVFLWLGGVDLVIHHVVFDGDSEETDAMNGTAGRA